MSESNDDATIGSPRAAPPGEETRASVLNLHLQQLRYLVEVVEAGSLGRAAQTLHVSQPALSQAMAELERRLGVALFERVGRGRRPTSAAREVLHFARSEER